ncbi:unnamed protein product [Auanema sp. JU1783]|nr:unnamed protein product [Auanema sp. JU1783]
MAATTEQEKEGSPVAKVPRLDMKQAFRINPILHYDIERIETPLEQFYVVELQNKKDIGKILTFAPEIDTAFNHLKRVDKTGRVLIQSAESRLENDVRESLLSKSEGSRIEVASVPKLKPITRRQFDWAKQYWSTSFHPNKETEELLDGGYFCYEKSNYVRKWINVANDAGCVVVQNGQELARGSQGTKLLSHPVMNMVEMLAKMEREQNDYLATGCDVFLRKEPCAMCSMALVHSRAHQVFFIEEQPRGTLAKGHWQLHLEPSINHHYKVFQVEL